MNSSVSTLEFIIFFIIIGCMFRMIYLCCETHQFRRKCAWKMLRRKTNEEKRRENYFNEPLKANTKIVPHLNYLSSWEMRWWWETMMKTGNKTTHTYDKSYTTCHANKYIHMYRHNHPYLYTDSNETDGKGVGIEYHLTDCNFLPK